MNTNKFVIGGVIAGVAYFLIGWLVWGILLSDFMMQHSSEASKAVMRKEEDYIMWAIGVANLLSGFLLSFIFSKANISSAGSGASAGAVIGLLMSASLNLMFYAFMDWSDTTGMAVDIAASTAVGGIVGGLLGWYMGRGK